MTNVPHRSAPSGASSLLEILQIRHRLLRQIRRFFDERGFLEVTTPLLSAETLIDPWIEPFRVTAFDDPRHPSVGSTCYLQTSPELHMKRLLAAVGADMYQVTSAFRGAEVGPLHNPEFTMVEWYRCGHDLQDSMELSGDLIVELLSCPRPRHVTYRDVFLEHVGFDPLPLADEELRHAFSQFPEARELVHRDDLLNWALATQIQPRLGDSPPVIVSGFPASQAALARLCPRDPAVAHRFELFCQGIELANGYAELTDARTIRNRQAQAHAKRADSGLTTLPTPHRFHAAMEQGLPSSAGVALGFDRVVMLKAGRSTLSEVLPFSWHEA